MNAFIKLNDFGMYTVRHNYRTLALTGVSLSIRGLLA